MYRILQTRQLRPLSSFTFSLSFENQWSSSPPGFLGSGVQELVSGPKTHLGRSTDPVARQLYLSLKDNPFSCSSAHEVHGTYHSFSCRWKLLVLVDGPFSGLHYPFWSLDEPLAIILAQQPWRSLVHQTDHVDSLTCKPFWGLSSFHPGASTSGDFSLRSDYIHEAIFQHTKKQCCCTLKISRMWTWENVSSMVSEGQDTATPEIKGLSLGQQRRRLPLQHRDKEWDIQQWWPMWGLTKICWGMVMKTWNKV